MRVRRHGLITDSMAKVLSAEKVKVFFEPVKESAAAERPNHVTHHNVHSKIPSVLCFHLHLRP